MPGWRPIAKQVITTVAIVSLLPMAVFYLTMSFFGLRAAAVVTLALYYVGLLIKVARGKPVLAAALLTAGLLSLRTVIMLFTGSAFVYFLQPVAGTLAAATLIALTALAGRPILDRLAHEFCPFPADLSSHLRQAGFFSRVSAVWSIAYVINACGTVWLLTNASLGGFLLLKSALGPALTATALLASYAIFRLSIRGQNVRLRWAHHQSWAHAAV
jgi:intracellular septation protein A